MQKNVIEEKLLEIKRSIRRGTYISFPDSYWAFLWIITVNCDNVITFLLP